MTPIPLTSKPTEARFASSAENILVQAVDDRANGNHGGDPDDETLTVGVDAPDVRQFGPLFGASNAITQVAGALPRDIHQVRISGDLIEQRQEYLWLGQQPTAVICITFKQRVIDAETVILHTPGQELEIFLLSGQPLENLEQLRGCSVERVVELGLISGSAQLPAKRFFAQAGNFAMHVEVLRLEMI